MLPTSFNFTFLLLALVHLPPARLYHNLLLFALLSYRPRLSILLLPPPCHILMFTHCTPKCRQLFTRGYDG
jgi:hypothetical protein